MWKLAADFKNAFPSYLEEEIVNILSHTSAKQSVPTYTSQYFAVLVNSKKINIPYRHTLDTPHPSNIFK